MERKESDQLFASFTTVQASFLFNVNHTAGAVSKVFFAIGFIYITDA